MEGGTEQGSALYYRHNVAAGGGLQNNALDRIVWTLQPKRLGSSSNLYIPKIYMVCPNRTQNENTSLSVNQYHSLLCIHFISYQVASNIHFRFSLNTSLEFYKTIPNPGPEPLLYISLHQLSRLSWRWICYNAYYFETL